MSKAKGFAVALVAALLVLGSVGTASAGSSKTNVTITKARKLPTVPGGVKVVGKVTSPRLLCEVGRKVSVYHDVPPPGPSKNDFKLGTTKTNGKGEWELLSSLNPDKVYARVIRTKKCKGRVSDTVNVK